MTFQTSDIVIMYVGLAFQLLHLMHHPPLRPCLKKDAGELERVTWLPVLDGLVQQQ